ncbi:conserved protein of unknown function [Candidatus Filomicrobium marinum]|uniref:Uncharacterized protein n=2 Tax=Filomicrobium TaxID=119044 RepID=A0A0D6JIL6_9HYPH|nr:conserved protein of unknown function [Candidatus Filomicrobium marinum]CPR21844.1 conserved protein of unknown function [Candidatus Filomicrobium marinum]SDP50458.1 hypothetical protein SAMN04488061_3214 [Filomicrobium insigne]
MAGDGCWGTSFCWGIFEVVWKGGRRTAHRAQEDSLEQATRGRLSDGGLWATLISAFALAFSGYSFYESVLRSPELSVYVPPRIEYTDPDSPDSPFEVFVLPLTVLNDGARTGTVLSIDLEVTNPRRNEVKRFYAARTGTWGTQPFQPFAPVSLEGKGSSSQALQFFPRSGERVARILDLEAGTYSFRLVLNTATTSSYRFLEPKTNPLEFEMQIDQLDYRNFSGAGTMAMWAADYRPISSGN